MLTNKEQNRNTSGKAKVEQNTRKTVDISDSGLYHKVAISSIEGCNISSI